MRKSKEQNWIWGTYLKMYVCVRVCVHKCLNTYEGAVAQLVCINGPCVRHRGWVAICLTANLQRSGEWDQTGGKITPHTPKWETIILPKVTQTQPRIRIIEQPFCTSFSFSILLSAGGTVETEKAHFFIYFCFILFFPPTIFYPIFYLTFQQSVCLLCILITQHVTSEDLLT